MIVVTGAAGFIGSYITGKLNREGFKDIVLVDKFNEPSKKRNYEGKTYRALIDRDEFFTWLAQHEKFVQFIIHLGACSDTTGQGPEIYRQLNFEYSKKIWKACVKYGLPLIYASSAATYGDGSKGFDDDHRLLPGFEPLNLYARSKHDFDKWALNQPEKPYFWAGLKFFNVYGPNEYHKGRMTSVVLQAFYKIRETGEMRLFRSNRPDIADGKQSRDFVYVEDVARVIRFFMDNRKNPGIYNVGTGINRTFLDLAKAVFKSMGKTENIHFTDMPADLAGKYQYYTCANIGKLRSAGYRHEFYTLEEGIDEYIKSFLNTSSCY